MKTLVASRMETCIGCHSCSLACARLVHRRLSWDTAGIRIASRRCRARAARRPHQASAPNPVAPAMNGTNGSPGTSANSAIRKATVASAVGY